jgi:hypothetical protein
MGLEIIRNKAQGIAINAGKAVLHSLAPDDFEYYACTLQLVNSYDEIVQIFNFPVMPNAMSIQRTPLVNIKKTARGFVDQVSDSFPGERISLSGTFGRKFRLLLTQELKKPNSRNPDVPDEEKVFLKDTFDAKVKTGYGALKLMEKMIKMSTQRDDQGNPYRLYFYNFAFNEQFLVEPIMWSKQQSLENNIMWNYSLEMRAISNAKDKSFQNGGSIKSLLTTAAVQKSLNDTFNNLTVGGISSGLIQ